MTEKTKGDEVHLKTLCKTSPSVICTLLPNFFTRPEYHGIPFVIKSTPFEFADANWQFKFYPDEETQDCKSFIVLLVRLNSEIPLQKLIYQITLLDGNDEHYSDFSHVYIFDKNNAAKAIVTFNNRNPSYDTRDNLTLVIEMFRGELTKEDATNEPFTMERDNDEHYSDFSHVYIFDKNNAAKAIVTFNNRNPSYDTRDNLTLVIEMFRGELTKEDATNEPFTMERGVVSLSQDFKDVLLNGQDHNLTFNVRDKEFRAHQDILRARSEVFRSMLSHNMLEKNSGVINVPDCDPHAFEQLLCYIYTGKVEALDANNMFDMYYAADKYNLAHLREQCCKFIKKSLTVTNVCNALELASKHSDESLLDSAMRYFFSNVDGILPTVEWQLFMKENSTVANELFIKSLKKARGTKT